MDKFIAFFQLIRWKNLLLLAINLILVKYIIFFHDKLISPKFNINYNLISSSILFITAGGYIINDFYDRKIDAINKPEKLLIGQLILAKEAVLYYFILNILAVILIMKLYNWLIISFIFSIILLWLYSFWLKNMPIVGNVIVAFLTALPLVIIALYFQINQSLLFTFAFFAFSISLIRELVKDIEDIVGDTEGGLKTFPIVFGVAKTKLLIKLILIIFTIAFIYLIAYISNIYIYFIIIFLSLFAWLFIKIQKAYSKTDFTYLSNFLKIIMLIGVISMIFV